MVTFLIEGLLRLLQVADTNAQEDLNINFPILRVKDVIASTMI